MDTKNLLIRRFKECDQRDFDILIKDKMKSKYAIYDDAFPTDDESLKNILKYFISTDEFLAIELKKINKIIGFASLNYVNEETRNIGYTIHSDYQGKGYGTEMINILIKYAKEILKVKKLISGTALENNPSCKLLEKAGFIKINSTKASFTNDEEGKSIIFTACEYELIL